MAAARARLYACMLRYEGYVWCVWYVSATWTGSRDEDREPGSVITPELDLLIDGINHDIATIISLENLKQEVFQFCQVRSA